jgi:hypothetical protein
LQKFSFLLQIGKTVVVPDQDHGCRSSSFATVSSKDKVVDATTVGAKTAQARAAANVSSAGVDPVVKDSQLVTLVLECCRTHVFQL